jgi:cellulose biosynthesis protein BcsQ
LPLGSLTLFSCGGGTGVTTLLATLGRALSLQGERVLLVDSAPESLLPYYFGSNVETTGEYAFMAPAGSAEGGISVMARGSRSQGSDARLWRGLRASARDRVLIDAWPDMTPESLSLLTATTTCVAVLVPDLLSVVRLRRLEETLAAPLDASGARLFVLLSRFDESLPLHREIRQGLARRVGDRLLPFTLRNSEQTALALADGATVVDYAPESGIAGDFKRLTVWVQEHSSLARVRSVSAARG